MNTVFSSITQGTEDMDTFGKNGEYRIQIARTIEQRQQAWALVHDAYVRKEYAAPQSDGLWYGLHDALPSTTTFLVTREDHVVAALTIVMDSPLGLPADELYRPELNVRRSRGCRLCEIISLVNEETNRRLCMECLRHMFRAAYLVAREEHGATDFVITVNPRHAAYYERRLLFEQSGPERAYDKVGGAPAVLLALDLTTVPNRYATPQAGPPEHQVRSFIIDPEAKKWLCRRLRQDMTPMSRSSLQTFFRERRPLLARATHMERDHIYAQYGMEHRLAQTVPAA